MKIIIGLGKTGASCAKYLTNKGMHVVVMDTRENPPELENFKKIFPDIEVHTGGIVASILEEADEIIVSPGISLKLPEISNQINKGKKVVGDIEIFSNLAKSKVVAITGSNGKSTVTSIVYNMAKDFGINVSIGGNFGFPALDLLSDKEPTLYVLELSSFQLETTFSLRPIASTVLNISEDHMDRYNNIDEYINAKMRVYNNCEYAIVNNDECFYKTQFFFERYPKLKNPISFGINPNRECDFGFKNGYLTHRNKKLLNSNELLIKGTHQISNALSALAIGFSIGLNIDSMVETLRKFTGLQHRCQWIASIDDVNYYNDSKGTNVGATKAAIEGLAHDLIGKIILIAGGQSKNADFSQLIDPIKKHVKTIILIGVDSKKIAQMLDFVSEIIFARSLEEAVKFAKMIAKKNDIVLMSPACASLDMFINYEHRGETFIKAVKNESTK